MRARVKIPKVSTGNLVVTTVCVAGDSERGDNLGAKLLRGCDVV